MPALSPAASSKKYCAGLTDTFQTPLFQSIEVILTGTTIPVNCFPGDRICDLVINDTNASDQPVPTTTGATTHKGLLSPIPGVATTALQTLVHQTLPQC